MWDWFFAIILILLFMVKNKKKIIKIITNKIVSYQ